MEASFSQIRAVIFHIAIIKGSDDQGLDSQEGSYTSYTSNIMLLLVIAMKSYGLYKL